MNRRHFGKTVIVADEHRRSSLEKLCDEVESLTSTDRLHEHEKHKLRKLVRLAKAEAQRNQEQEPAP